MSSGEKKEIKLDSKFSRNSSHLYNEIDGEIVMLSIGNEEYYNLDKVGSEIWKFIDIQRSFREIVTMLLDEYDVTEDICIKDIKPYLEELISKELITCHND